MSKGKYITYKNSGVSWLGDIPEHWEIRRIKYVFKELDSRSEAGNEDLLSVSQYTGVTKKSDKVAEGENISNAKTLEGYKIVEKGDLVINIMLAWNGSLGISKYNGIVSPAYCVYKNRVGNEKYFGYLFKTKNAQQEFKKQSTGIIDSRLRMYTDSFFDIKTALPPKHEQTTIANFLDYKTEKINRFIKKKKQLIKLLYEQNAAIVNQAVTQGLDPNVPMKDSGIEWLGDIPEHYEVRKIKSISKKSRDSIKPGPFGSDLKNIDIQKEGYKVYNQRAVLDEDYFNTKDCINLKKFEDLKTFRITEGDILLTSRGTIGRCSIVPKNHLEGVIHPCIIRLRINPKLIIPDFVKLFIEKSEVFQTSLKINSNATTINVIYGNTLKGVVFLTPPIPEQQAIVAYIKNETKKIDKTISTIQKEINLVEEYKTALIAEAVTGKIDVRDFKLSQQETPLAMLEEAAHYNKSL